MTPADLIQEYIDRRGQSWTVGTIPRKDVSQLNTAIRWACKDHDPSFPLPETLDTATVTPVDGKIAAADLGDASFASVWSEDPRPVSATVEPYQVIPDIDGGAQLICELASDATTVFVFFRKTIPQITYENGGEYTEPELPDQLRFPILMYAMGIFAGDTIALPEKNGFTAIATEWMNKRKEAIGFSKPLWMRNHCSL